MPRASDPYRVLFDRLAAGAAHCRLVIVGDRVVDVEILDANPAFAAVRGVVAQLGDLLTRMRATGASETQELVSETALLEITAHPVDPEHAMLVVADVTARFALEQRARESQGRFEQAFHGNAAAMVIAHQHDLRILEVNPRWLELFGATRDEVIGRTAVELGLITEERASSRITEHKQFAQGYDTELALRTRAGADLTVLASARPIELPEGICTLTTLIDITSRKHAEEAFALAFGASPAGMLLVDVASDRVVAVNARMLEMTGEPRDHFLGHTTVELDLTRSPSRHELLAEVSRTGRLDAVEVELECRTGPGLWTLASTELVVLHGKPHRLSAFTDITVRKRFEQRLVTQHEVGRRLAEASSLDAALPRVLEALARGEGWDSGAVWLPGADDGGLQCRGTWRSAAISVEQATAARELAMARHGLVSRVMATATAEKLALDAPAGGLGYAVGFPILRGNAVLGVVALAARRGDALLHPAELGLFEAIGRLLGLFIERARGEAALRELNTQLERRVRERTSALETSNRDLEAFSSSVSHDLRAPLRAVHSFSQILLDDYAADLPGDARNLIARIHASGDRLRGLIDDLLQFSRLGRDELRTTQVELDPLVRAVVDELLVDRGLDGRLDLRIAPLGSCLADPSLLRPVWTNLIDNALKYARTRERIEIEIGREQRAGETVYFVRDNGVGFDMQQADRLFGVFQRLHSATEFEGTGIGLANVRRIVERHHGRVAASSEPGRGSRFEFTLAEGRAQRDRS